MCDNDDNGQGSGVELELGDSTSLKWEEQFVLTAQRFLMMTMTFSVIRTMVMLMLALR